VPDAKRPGLVLDAGALLAVESGKLTDVLSKANAVGLPIRVSGGAVAQAWRGGPRSARLAALLKKNTIVIALDMVEARRLGEFITRVRLKRSERPDIVDAHAAFIARETRSLVYTSDTADLTRYGVPAAMIRRV
jgi:hypothetical protein